MAWSQRSCDADLLLQKYKIIYTNVNFFYINVNFSCIDVNFSYTFLKSQITITFHGPHFIGKTIKLSMVNSLVYKPNPQLPKLLVRNPGR